MNKMSHDNSESFESIFINDRPMIDLRAPVEFSQGAFPAAVNLPLMTNEEREMVGICYKKTGQDSAIKLGNKLVSGKQRKTRISNV